MIGGALPGSPPFGRAVPPIRIAVVGGHEMVRVGLRHALETEPDMEVAGEAASGEAAVALARRERPDVMLLDVTLGEGGMDGPAACRSVLEASPRTAVLVLTDCRQDAAALTTLTSGAAGHLPKSVALAELKRVVRAVHGGAAAPDPPAVPGRERSPMAAPPAAGAPAGGAVARLTDLDLEIIRLLSQGLSNKEIGARVRLSPYTVKDHLKKIGSALSARSRTEIVARALRRGLV